MSHVSITITDPRRPSSARVISFDTTLDWKELLQALAVMKTLLSHYAGPGATPPLEIKPNV